MSRRRKRLNLRFFRNWFKSILSLAVKSFPWATGSLIVFFLFVSVRQMVHADPYFQIEKIKVFPTGILTASEIQYLESKTQGKSVLELNLNELARTLERNPKVERAEITRVLPKQLSVFLVRRLPILQIILTARGPYYLVSNDQLVTSIQQMSRPEYIILEDFESKKKKYSIGMLYQNSHFDALEKLYSQIQSDEFLRKETVTRMTIDKGGNFSIFLKDGLELKVGHEISLTPSTEMVLRSLLKSRDRSEYLYLDLRYHDIIIKKKSD